MLLIAMLNSFKIYTIYVYPYIYLITLQLIVHLSVFLDYILKVRRDIFGSFIFKD